MKYLWFGKLQEIVANPVLMMFMDWNLEEVVVKPFTSFYNEISTVLEASGGCESIIDGLESPRSCCEAIYALLQ